jgi:hypothetical protein
MKPDHYYFQVSLLKKRPNIISVIVGTDSEYLMLVS